MKKRLIAQINLFINKPIKVSYVDGPIVQLYLFFIRTSNLSRRNSGVYRGLSADFKLHSFLSKLNLCAEDSSGVRVQ